MCHIFPVLLIPIGLITDGGLVILFLGLLIYGLKLIFTTKDWRITGLFGFMLVVTLIKGLS